MKPLWKTALWMSLLGLPQLLWAAAPVATATIVDGEVLVIREAKRLQLAEGVRLGKDDIVEATAKSRFVRIEFSDGVILDLGPESRVLLSPKLAGDRASLSARLYLLSGVAKITVPHPQDATPAVLTSPALDVLGMARSAVFIVQNNDAYGFAESGEVVLQERRGGKVNSNITLKSGEFFARADDAKPTVTARPSPAFIQRLPRAFLDTLPSRAALFKAREVEPKPLGSIAYADVDAWVDADGLRPLFLTRWKALAQDPEFRKGLLANLRAHPEWDRTLNPEKYRPKQASAGDTSPRPAKP